MLTLYMPQIKELQQCPLFNTDQGQRYCCLLGMLVEQLMQGTSSLPMCTVNLKV